MIANSVSLRTGLEQEQYANSQHGGSILPLSLVWTRYRAFTTKSLTFLYPTVSVEILQGIANIIDKDNKE
jgi:hypothetical protein